MAERTVDVVAKKVLLVCDRCRADMIKLPDTQYDGFGNPYYFYYCPECKTSVANAKEYPYIQSVPIR